MPSWSGTLSEKFLPSAWPSSSMWPVPGKKSGEYLWNETVRTRFVL